MIETTHGRRTYLICTEKSETNRQESRVRQGEREGYAHSTSTRELGERHEHWRRREPGGGDSPHDIVASAAASAPCASSDVGPGFPPLAALAAAAWSAGVAPPTIRWAARRWPMMIGLERVSSNRYGVRTKLSVCARPPLGRCSPRRASCRRTWPQTK